MDTDIELEVLEEERTPDESFELIGKCIEDESEEFLQSFFSEEISLCTYHMELIEENSFFVPYKNHIKMKTLIDKIFRLLKSYDEEFSSKTLLRLQKNIDYIWFKRREFDEKSTSVKQIFLKKTIMHSDILHFLKSQIILLKKKRDLSDLLKKQLDRLESDFDRLKQYYYQDFYDYFLEYKISLAEEFAQILNTYVFYFEKIMWEDAKSSKQIRKQFKKLNIKGLDTKHFVAYQLGIMHPYSNEYAKLLEIYRNYR